MGDGFVITCPKCQYKVDTPLGSGELYDDLRNMMHRVPYRQRKQVAEILEKHSVEKTDCYHDLLVCPKCSRLAGRFHYRIEYDHGLVLENLHQCGRCRTALVSFGGGLKELNQTLCPQCHDAMLEAQEYPPWD